MASANSRYDHPLYMVRDFFGGSLGASAGVRFCAYTSMLVKSVNIKPTTAGTTAAQVFALKQVLAANTTTTTVALTTYGSAAAGGTTIVPTTTLTLAVGDAISVENAGTDATGVYAIGVELAIVNGANYTL